MELLSILASFLLSYLVLCLLLSIFLDADLTTSLYDKLGGGLTSKLEGRVLWITGASGGLGAALAVQAARHGAKLVLSARRKKELERVKKLCVEAGRYRDLKNEDILVVPLDLTKTDTHLPAVRTVLDKMGKVSSLVHCAMKVESGDWMESTLMEDTQVFQVNVLGCVNLARLVLPSMLYRSGGSFGLVVRQEAVLGAPFYGSLAGSHRSLSGYFKALHHQYCAQGIRVTFFSPGELKKNCETKSQEGEGTPGEGKRDQEGLDRGITVERAARLCLVGLAHNLPWVWIASYPVLTMLYFHQYFPDICHRLVTSVGPRILAGGKYGSLIQDTR